MNVDLNHLRIRDEPATRARSRLPLVLLVLLLPLGFALGWFLRGGPAALVGDELTVRTVEVRAEGGGAPTTGGGTGFTEGGWVEVPSYHPIVVSALLPGRVEEIRFLEGSRVEKGQLVARLYAKDLEDALAVAKAKVATAQAELDLMTAGYRKEDVEKARHELERLGREADLRAMIEARTRALVPDGAASAEDLERDAAAARIAAAAAEAARAELRKLEAGYRAEEVARARAELAQAVATRDQAATRLSWTKIESPASGVVLERYVTPGTYLLRIPKDLNAQSARM